MRRWGWRREGCERVGLEGERGWGCARVGGREGCVRVRLEEEGVEGEVGGREGV